MDLAPYKDLAAFRGLCARTPALGQIETGYAGLPKAPAMLRVGAWNLERCKHPAESARRIANSAIDLLMLSEMDDGMARSGNLNTTRVLAEALRMTYAFGVEFIETGHGTESERALYAGMANHKGFHGNAILSRFALSGLDLLRLPGGEVWADMDWHDSRLGSRMALGGTIDTQAGSLAVVSLHLESLPGPAERADHMRRVVEFVERTYPGMPVLLGGDLNTADLPEGFDQDQTAPAWFVEPDGYEPLFAPLRSAGYEWMSANTAQHTRRQIANGRPFRPFKKVDWLFVRGCAATRPVVHPATDANGSPISDHELIVADITLAL